MTSADKHFKVKTLWLPRGLESPGTVTPLLSNARETMDLLLDGIIKGLESQLPEERVYNTSIQTASSGQVDAGDAPLSIVGGREQPDVVLAPEKRTSGTFQDQHVCVPYFAPFLYP